VINGLEIQLKEMEVVSLTRKSNGGFYISEEVGFEPEVKPSNKNKGDKKDGKKESNKQKQKK
jgi:hypothetical protein